jgi:hypothetical protein
MIYSLKDTAGDDAPGLEGYDRGCVDVYQQGQRQVSHLGSVGRVDEHIVRLKAVIVGTELHGPQHDRRQVND